MHFPYARIAISIHGLLALVVMVVVLERVPRPPAVPLRPPERVPFETSQVAPSEPESGVAKPTNERPWEGPSKDLRYRVTRVGTNYGRMFAPGRRTTWEISLGDTSKVRIVREASDEALFLNTDVHARAWKVVGEARYTGRCDAISSGSCVSEENGTTTLADDLRIQWTRESATGTFAEATESLGWRCTRSKTKTLLDTARFHHGNCSGPGGLDAWLPASRPERTTLRCDGDRVTEPRVDSPGDEPYVGQSAIVGLHFAESAGIEWIDEMQDCPVPGVFRSLPATTGAGT